MLALKEVTNETVTDNVDTDLKNFSQITDEFSPCRTFKNESNKNPKRASNEIKKSKNA